MDYSCVCFCMCTFLNILRMIFLTEERRIFETAAFCLQFMFSPNYLLAQTLKHFCFPQLAHCIEIKISKSTFPVFKAPFVATEFRFNINDRHSTFFPCCIWLLPFFPTASLRNVTHFCSHSPMIDPQCRSERSIFLISAQYRILVNQFDRTVFNIS